MLQIIITALVVLCDQLSKYILEPILLDAGGKLPLLNGVISLRLAHNTGVAFGMLGNMQIVMVIITLAIILLVVFVMFKTRTAKSTLYRLSTALILGGALGNLIDRISFGYVVDFFMFEFIDFAIFNVADIAISCGGVLLAVYLLFYAKKDTGSTILQFLKDKPVKDHEA